MIVKVAVPEKFKLKVVPDFRTLIFGGQKEIHYIGGTEVLPRRLKMKRKRKRSDGWEQKMIRKRKNF